MAFMTTSAATDYMLAGYDSGGSVTYTPADGAVAFTVALASWADLTVQEVAASGGLFTAGDRKFMLGVNQFSGGRVPLRGDKITDPSSVAWYVALEATNDALGAVWQVHCTRAR